MKRRNNPHSPLLPAVIQAACYGDADALAAVLRHYEAYITRLSLRRFYDEYGNKYSYIDEDRRERLRIKLISGILSYRPC